ncbi:MAG TPA: hypothetical protein VMB66_04850 [Candidatus Acidoferrales bacterium]|jgi:hypothetical protein|nr:hypothetical protein [Candidatus Acidoferrales bacterium]
MITVANHRLWHWFVDHLLWDTAGSANSGFLGAIWAIRKPIIALALTLMLTWREWVDYHPLETPVVALVAIVNFVLVFAAIALLVFTLQRFSRTIKTR